jgi:hypothetical protein
MLSLELGEWLDLGLRNFVVRPVSDRNLDLEIEGGVLEGFMFEVRENGV